MSEAEKDVAQRWTGEAALMDPAWWARPDVKALEKQVLTQVVQWDNDNVPADGRYMLIAFDEVGNMFGPPPADCLPSPIRSPFGVIAGQMHGVMLIVRYTTLLGLV